MLRQRCLELQTELVDLFLPELTQSNQGNVVNFNNPKQLDTLLRHLELGLQATVFNMVPTTTILHILFTLSIRAPSLNWSHGFSDRESIFTSEYLKQVNRTYDGALYREPLQRRAVLVLQKYIEIIKKEQLTAVDLLYARLEEVVLCLVYISNTRAPFARLSRIASLRREPEKEPEDPYRSRFHAIEVISDSEESDAIVEAAESLAMDEFAILSDQKNVHLFTDPGNCASGLGEMAVLFKGMPHLLAQVTPEPSDSDDQKRKKVRSSPSVDQVQLFDDFLLCKKLLDPGPYDIWSLIRWAFYCADLSSQYQDFLFNSSQSKVHEICMAYNDTLQLIVLFCLLSMFHEKRFKPNLGRRLFNGLGSDLTLYDRAIEFIFTGLGVSSNDLPTPCYAREKILLNWDPVVQITQCKEPTIINDNATSMKLRLQLLLMLYANTANTLQNLEVFATVLRDKLTSLCEEVTAIFFEATLEQVFLCKAEKVDYQSYYHVLLQVCIDIIARRTDLKIASPKDYTGSKLAKVICDADVFLTPIRKGLFEPFDVFYKKWIGILRLCGWLIEGISVLNERQDFPWSLLREKLNLIRKSIGELLKPLQQEFCHHEEELFTADEFNSDVLVDVNPIQSIRDTEECNEFCKATSVEVKVERKDDTIIEVTSEGKTTHIHHSDTEALIATDSDVEEVVCNWNSKDIQKCLEAYDGNIWQRVLFRS